MSLYDKIHETADFIKGKISTAPAAGIILGSGLGGLVDLVTVSLEIPYGEIPNFPVSTVKGHAGKLIFGTIADTNVVMMGGRFHYYEGYSMEEVTFPVRVMKALGVDTLVVSNAAGCMNVKWKVGDIMIITDHINQFPEHPLRGANDERLGPRFPDMTEVYDKALIGEAKKIAAAQGLDVKEGVYVGLQGPTFETKAEYGWLLSIGGDVVGMSTVPEVIVARHGGMRVFAASIVTDMGIREDDNVITHEEVLAAANEAAPKLAGLVASLVGGTRNP
ncbi:MAG: purine-nucleoside phosphorylase [Flavipsychrobacter sp.]|nr:purine-nucleoside phosphorylase [Flavipsychrobacter sp.]